MTRRLLAVLTALALAATGSYAQSPTQSDPGMPERVYTLDEALRLIRNDPRLQSAEQDVIIATSRVTEAELSFLPEFGVQASATKYNALYPFALSGDFRSILLFPNANQENIYSSRAYFNLNLYEGQRGLNTLRLAQAAQQQALARRDSVRMDLFLEVKEAFYRLLLTQEKADAAEEHRRQVAAIVSGAGLGAWETVEAQAALAAARTRASDASHELETNRLAFLKALNLELDTPFHLSGRLVTEPAQVEVEQSVLRAMDARPELRSQTYKAQMDSIAVNLAMSRRYPSLFLAGDYELTAQDFPLNKNNWDLSIGFKLPFTYDFWSQLQQKKAEQRQGQLTRAELQDRVRLEVRQAAESLRYWQDEWPRREQQWKRVSELYQAASGKAGAALSRIRAREGLLELKISYLTAVTEHLLARARLERAVGGDLAP